MTDWRQERDQALLVLTQEKKSPEERAAAAEVLVHLAADDHARWEELRFTIPQLLEDKEPYVRRSVVALAALVLPEAEVHDFLAARLKDPHEDVRMEAAGQIADRARPEDRGALAVALADSAFLVRFEAARGMAALHHSAGRDVLCEALDDSTLRFRAISALGELGDKEALAPLKKMFKKWLLPAFDRTQAAGALARLGDPEGGAFLLQRTRSSASTLDRPMAVELCGEAKVEGGKARLLEVLADKSDPARGAAARGLGRLGDASALPALSAVLEEGGLSEDSRWDVAEGLCRLGGEQALALVQSALAKAQSEEERAELKLLLEEYAA